MEILIDLLNFMAVNNKTLKIAIIDKIIKQPTMHFNMFNAAFFKIETQRILFTSYI